MDISTQPAPEPIDSRHLDWPRCVNVRDLGGIRTLNGSLTRRRSLIRADTSSRLRPEGVEAARAYGVRTIVDLRSSEEVASDPVVLPGFVRDTDLIHYIHRPLERYIPEADTLVREARSRAEVYTIMLDFSTVMIADALRAVVEARPGGVVFHCQAGKDRTGILAALLLDLVGVDRDDIAADYVESQRRLWPLYEERLASATHASEQDAWFKPICLPETIQRLLDHVDAKYGGTERYLVSSGLTRADVTALRARLLVEEKR